jgi:hypothetical protein
MATLDDNNIQTLGTGPVNWVAVLNDFVTKYNNGRTLKLTAGETLTKGAPFYVKAADGKAWKATNATKKIGVWQSTSTTADTAGYGQIGGTMTFGAWTANDLLYANSSGALTATATGNGNPIAYALSATKIMIIPQVIADILPSALGSADQVLGINAGGTAPEYKTIQGTADEIEVTHGANSITIGAVNPVKKVVSQSLDHAAFTDNGDATGYIDITTQIPANSIVLGWKAVVSEGFAGDTTAVIQVGVDGTLDKYSASTAESVLAPGTVGSSVKAGNVFEPALKTVRVTVTGGADWGNITAGTMVVTVFVMEG